MTDAVICPVCNASEVGRLRPYRNPDGVTAFDGLSIYQCQSCVLGFASPTPVQAELDAYYAADYRSSPLKLPDSPPIHAVARTQSQLLYLTQVASPRGMTRWLDIGAGFGLLLDKVQSSGIQTAAIEPEPLGRQRIIANGHQLFDSLKSAGGQSWDVISFLHVLEHVPQPQRFLQDVYDALRPGGYALCEVPNEIGLMESLSDIPHLLFFQAGSLQKLFEDRGFLVLRAGSCGDLWDNAQAGSGYGMARLITRLANRSRRQPPLWLAKRIFKHFKCSDSFDRKWLRVVAQKPSDR